MSEEPKVRDLERGLALVHAAVGALVDAAEICIRDSDPPSKSGLYLFLIGGKVVYVGEAKGSGGLRDRILRKHVAGDEGHALQRHFALEFPDRVLRREHIRCSVFVKWVELDRSLVSIAERAAIWLLDPELNRK